LLGKSRTLLKYKHMLNVVVVPSLLALFANAITEWILAVDLQQPLRALTQTQRALRIARWLLIWLGLITAAHFIPSSSPLIKLLPLTLFSISAATDLETKFLPPDAFVYGGVLIGCAVAFLTDGPIGLCIAIAAQALCFALWTLGVAFFNLCDAGDIKLAMQFGAACGSLASVAIAGIVVWLAACGVVLMGIAIGLRTRPLREAVRCAGTFRPPQGPLLWCGLLVALCWPAWRAALP
jgi:hypothetical protein